MERLLSAIQAHPYDLVGYDRSLDQKYSLAVEKEEQTEIVSYSLDYEGEGTYLTLLELDPGFIPNEERLSLDVVANSNGYVHASQKEHYSYRSTRREKTTQSPEEESLGYNLEGNHALLWDKNDFGAVGEYTLRSLSSSTSEYDHFSGKVGKEILVSTASSSSFAHVMGRLCYLEGYEDLDPVNEYLLGQAYGVDVAKKRQVESFILDHAPRVLANEETIVLEFGVSVKSMLSDLFEKTTEEVTQVTPKLTFDASTYELIRHECDLKDFYAAALAQYDEGKVTTTVERSRLQIVRSNLTLAEAKLPETPKVEYADGPRFLGELETHLVPTLE